MDQINLSEKEVSQLFQIPMKTLKRCRNEGRFSLDICFTAPFSHKILYNKAKFDEWFSENKLPGLYTENQYIKARVACLNKQLKDLTKSAKAQGLIPDGRRKRR